MTEPAANPERDAHLFGPGPKAILSLDGGGVRGIVSIAFLQRIEALLAAACGRPVRLADAFDMIGGTSTGAIIAAGLTLGYSANDVCSFYMELAPRIFRRSYWRLALWHAKFDAIHLRRELQRIIGDRTLGSPDIITGLGLVTKRLDTGSAWIVSNNPRGPFWRDGDGGGQLGNHQYRVANIVRASAAAPHFFDPEPIAITQAGLTGLFVDGAVTPYNNPSLSLLLLVALPQHGLNWALGADKLTLVSIGTGGFRAKLTWSQARRMGAVGLAVSSLAAMISDNQLLTLGVTQALGKTQTPWFINSEVGDMTGLNLPGGPLFSSLRYDLRLEEDWLQGALGRSFSEKTLKQLQRLDDPRSIALLHDLATEAAEKQVKIEHLAAIVGKLSQR